VQRRHRIGAGGLGMAAMLSLGVAAWSHGLRAVGLIGGDIWVGGFAHTFRDGLLAFPFAVIAVAVGIRSVRRRQTGAASAYGLLCRAALVTLVFALLLVPAAGLHHLVDRALDGAAHAHAYHGQVRAAVVVRFQGLSPALQQGLRDAFLASVVGLPLALFGLTLRFGTEQNRPLALTATVAFTLPALVLGAVGVGLASPDGLGKGRHTLSGHAPLVTSVIAGTPVEAGDLRIAVQSAKWVRHPRIAEPDRAARTVVDLDRLYLEIKIDNLSGAPNSVGRSEFQMRARDGTVWTPLADDFPAILLDPGESMNTWLVFEVPPEAAHLELVSSAGAQEARIPIDDDFLGGILGELCRVLAKPWKG
jgi:hypothetical protein